MTKKDKVSNTSTDVKHEGQTTDLLAEKEHLTKHVEELKRNLQPAAGAGHIRKSRRNHKKRKGH